MQKEIKDLKKSIKTLSLSEEKALEIAKYLFLLESMSEVTTATVDVLDNLRVVIDKTQDENKYLVLNVLNEYSETIDQILVERILLEKMKLDKTA